MLERDCSVQLHALLSVEKAVPNFYPLLQQPVTYFCLTDHLRFIPDHVHFKMPQNKPIDRTYFSMVAGRMLPMVALLLVTIFYSHGLSLENYAIFQSVWMYSNIISVIMGYGITTIIFSTNVGPLISFVRKHKKNILIFYSTLWTISLLVFLIVTSFPDSLKWWIVFFFVLQNANTITETWLIKNNGGRIYFYLNLGYSLLFLVWHLIILNIGYHLLYLIMGITGLSIIKLCILVRLTKQGSTPVHEPAYNRKLAWHWAFAGTNDVLGILGKWIDKLVLIYILVPADFAIFFNGSIEIPLFAILVGMTGNYMMLQMSKTPGDNSRMKVIFRENFLLLSSVIFPLFFFLFFFRNDLFLILFGKKYLASVPVFAVTILILPLRINHYSGILQVFAKSNLVSLGAVIDLIIAILMIFILYPIYGMQGAAAALVVSTLIQITFYLLISASLLKIDLKEMVPFLSLIIRFVICGLLFFLLKWLTETAVPLIAISSGFILFLALSYFLGRKFITAIIRNRF